LRRAAQLRRLRPDVTVESMRGNVDTRLTKLQDGQYDAIVLAAAGLKRLNRDGQIAEILGVDVMVPAVGQGALAVETTAGGPAAELVLPLDDTGTRAAVTAERAVLASLGGGCLVPIGAHAVMDRDTFHLIGIVISPDGSRQVRAEMDGVVSQAEQVGQ